MSNYRFDNRSKDQFKFDILRCSVREAIAALRFCVFLKEKFGEWPNIIPSGSNHEGKFLDDKNVNTYPDFIIDNTPVEITMSNRLCKKPYFHEKCGKVSNCINNLADMLFINGFDESEPSFVWMNSNDLKRFSKDSEKKYGKVRQPGLGSKITNKPAYRYDFEWFDWHVLPKIPKMLPRSYVDIVNFIKDNRKCL